MGIQAIYPGPRTSISNKEHKKYPYLLRNLEINRPNQVWATDITYIPMPQGFMYLVAIMDWYSRFVIAWQLSNTLDSNFCVDALQMALQTGKPDIFNSDQGSQAPIAKIPITRIQPLASFIFYLSIHSKHLCYILP